MRTVCPHAAHVCTTYTTTYLVQDCETLNLEARFPQILQQETQIFSLPDKTYNLKNVYPKELVDLKLNPYTNMDFRGSLFHPGALRPCFSKKKLPLTNDGVTSPSNQKGTCRAVSFRTSGTTERKFCCCST